MRGPPGAKYLERRNDKFSRRQRREALLTAARRVQKRIVTAQKNGLQADIAPVLEDGF